MFQRTYAWLQDATDRYRVQFPLNCECSFKNGFSKCQCIEILMFEPTVICGFCSKNIFNAWWVKVYLNIVLL